MSLELDFSKGASIITIIGKCGSGKSHLTKSLIKQLCEQGFFKFGKVFSGTGKINADYNFMPEGSVDGDYTEAKLQAYIGKLEKWCEDHPGQKLPANFLILDDLIGIMKPNTSGFSHLITIYRHLSCTVLILSQYMVKNVSTLLRELCDHAFLFKSNFKNTRTALYEAFGQICEDEHEFLELYDQAVSVKHSCLHYDANGDTKEEAYTGYKAPAKIKDFELKFKPVQ